jgi:hypothetical protein
MSVIQDTLTTIACKNCETVFEGKFCPNCSQTANTHRFTLYHFAHEFLHALTHTDKGMLFLIKEMFRKPGQVALEYNAGKRKKYFNPITFLLVMMALQVLVLSKTRIYERYTDSLQVLTQQLAGKPAESSDALKNTDKKTAYMNGQMSMVEENNKLLTFIFIPVLALFTWLFFKKAGHNYAENLMFNVLLNGQLMVFFLLFIVVPFLIKPSLVVLWLLLFLPISWTYSLIAYKQFFRQGWGRTILKGLVLQTLYMMMVTGATTVVFNFLKK